MVSFLHLWALENFCALAEHLGRSEDASRYRELAERIRTRCREVLWDGG